MLSFFLILFFTLLLTPRQALAIYDPLSEPNNKYGIHIADTNDISAVDKLVNSSGGDWGYVTLVIPETDRNTGKWQGIFDLMRRKHLIPLVRLATQVKDGNWIKPEIDKLDDWVSFLSSLNWPVENRYIILYNEPNHAKEWGGGINPENYAQIALALAQKLKDASTDFFILPAALDVSAASDGQSLDAVQYLKRMLAAAPDLPDYLDGWNSHSYPNPGFSGSPYASGRGTLTSFDWEITLLQSLGVDKKLPIFITETGWQHSDGKSFAASSLSPQTVARYINIAAITAWSNSRIAAITPFIYNYQDYPFDHFSWKKIGSEDYYDQFYAYASLPKAAGVPRQIWQIDLESDFFPDKLVTSSVYTFSATVRNRGQGIITPQENQLVLTDLSRKFTSLPDNLPYLERDQKSQIRIHIKTPNEAGDYPLKIGISTPNQTVTLVDKTIAIVPPPSVSLKTQMGWKTKNHAPTVTVLVYEDATLIHKLPSLTLTDGHVSAGGLANIIPGKTYRVVLLVPGYLPRQIIAPLSAETTSLTLPRLLPLDFNNDGTLSIKDLLPLLQSNPHTIIGRFFGPS